MGNTLPHTHGIDVTNRFVLDFALRRGGKVLDYGCGSGRVVIAGRREGLQIFVVPNVFYGGSATRAEVEASGVFGGVVREIGADGRIPFPDGFFDLVTNNQVMEHVEDLDAVLGEIHRVLRPGGKVLSVFPSVDVWREGHIGIPFSHWFPRGSTLRFYYTWMLRACGLGTWKEQAPTARQWALDKLDWIDRWTRYRSRRAIFATYDRLFRNRLREREYIVYRLMDAPGGWRGVMARLMRAGPFAAAAEALFRKLAFLVIVSEKR